MKICFVTQELVGYEGMLPGGVGRYVTDLASNLARDDEVTVILSAEQMHMTTGRYPFKVEVVRRPSGRLPGQIIFPVTAWRMGNRVKKLVAQRRVEVLDGPLAWGQLGTYVLHKTVPIVTRLVSCMAQLLPVAAKRKNWLRRTLGGWAWRPTLQLEKNMLERSDCIITPGWAELESVREYHDFSNDRIEVIPFSMPDISPPPEREEARAIVGYRSDRPLLLYIGRLEYRKGSDTLALASKSLREWEMTFVLLGPDVWPGGFPAFLRKQGIAQDEQFILLGRRSEEEKTAWIAAADACVFPSRWESFGLVVVEGMRQARPVICSNAGGMGEIAADNPGVIAVPPADPEALAEAIEHVLRMNEAQRTAMGRAGRRVYEERYTAEVVIPQNIALYESLL